MLEVRKRVFLKSPVREIRTPGSARGASGNRRVYRDCKIALLGVEVIRIVPSKE